MSVIEFLGTYVIIMGVHNLKENEVMVENADKLGSRQVDVRTLFNQQDNMHPDSSLSCSNLCRTSWVIVNQLDLGAFLHAVLHHVQRQGNEECTS